MYPSAVSSHSYNSMSGTTVAAPLHVDMADVLAEDNDYLVTDFPEISSDKMAAPSSEIISYEQTKVAETFSFPPSNCDSTREFNWFFSLEDDILNHVVTSDLEASDSFVDADSWKLFECKATKQRRGGSSCKTQLTEHSGNPNVFLAANDEATVPDALKKTVCRKPRSSSRTRAGLISRPSSTACILPPWKQTSITDSVNSTTSPTAGNYDSVSKMMSEASPLQQASTLQHCPTFHEELIGSEKPIVFSSTDTRKALQLGLGHGAQHPDYGAAWATAEVGDFRDDGIRVRRCTHCLSSKTPQWRAGPAGLKTLCNACGVRYKSGRLCDEYRPAKSPTFLSYKHSNSHKKVLEMRRRKGLANVSSPCGAISSFATKPMKKPANGMSGVTKSDACLSLIKPALAGEL